MNQLIPYRTVGSSPALVAAAGDDPARQSLRRLDGGRVMVDVQASNAKLVERRRAP
jgi:hypothetical protein